MEHHIFFRIKILTVLFILFTSFSAYAQNRYSPEQIEEILEKISENSEISARLDEIEYFIYNPIELSVENLDKISSLPGFSLTESAKIKELLEKSSEITSDQISIALKLSRTQKLILKLCTSSIIKKKLNVFTRLNESRRLSRLKGFTEGIYSGDENNFSQRYRFSYAGSEAGLILSKSAGETDYYDFNSAYIKTKISSVEIFAGDFTVSNGMGSVLWESFGQQKGTDAISPAVQYGNGIKQNLSASENSFFRGIGIKHNFEIPGLFSIKYNGWLSYTPRSGALDSSQSIAETFYSTGYYRTENEISKKHTFNETAYGISIEISKSYFRLGSLLTLHNFDKKIKTESSSLFDESKNFLSSHYLYFTSKSINFGSEISFDNNGSAAFQSGLQYYGKELSAAIAYREFSSDFRTNYGYSFSESYTPTNLRSIFSAIKIPISKFSDLTAYIEFYKRKIPSYFSAFPGEGNEFFIQQEFYIAEKVKLLFRASYNKNEVSYYNDSLKKRLADNENRTKLRAEITYYPYDFLKIKGRAEYSRFLSRKFPEAESEGISGFLDVSGKLSSYLSCGLRLTGFDTEDFNSAIWEFEGFIPGSMESPVLYGSGYKGIIYANINFGRYFNLWFKWKYLEKFNVSSLGSGLNETANNTDRTLSVQLEFKY